MLEEFCRRTGGEAVDEKERKTIKRRVYDSINVLIALGKIKKEQKWLYVEPADPTLGLEIIKAKGQTLGTLGMELINKHQSFSRAKRQYEQLKALKSRNESLKQFVTLPISRIQCICRTSKAGCSSPCCSFTLNPTARYAS